MKRSIITSIFVSLIFHLTSHPSLPNPFPADISFCIADLKYDGQRIKICEFGDGMRSMFYGHDQLYEKGKIWTLFWHFLQQTNTPVWFLGAKPPKTRAGEMALGTLQKMSISRFVDKVANIENHKMFPKKTRKKNIAAQSLSESGGVVIFKNSFTPSFFVSEFVRKYPGFIFLDSSTKKYISDKYETDKLFQDPNLQPFRPRCKAYPKKYASDLAETICSDLQSKIYVIKPINAAKGDGVIMVEKKDLEKTLKLIVLKDPLPLALSQDSSYTYWKNDRNPLFLVEEFVGSKPLVVEEKVYDPTMRVIFVLYNDNGLAQVQFLGAYWKLPAKSLDQKGTLTELYKSKISGGKICSVKVSPEDYSMVTTLLEPMLCTAYIKMLSLAYPQE